MDEMFSLLSLERSAVPTSFTRLWGKLPIISVRWITPFSTSFVLISGPKASVSDLSRTMENARSAQAGQSSSAGALRQMLFDIPGDGGGDLMRDMDGIQNMRAGQPGGVDPNMMSPQELHGTLWQILSFRDSVMKRIEVRQPFLTSIADADLYRIPSIGFRDSPASLRRSVIQSPSS